MITLFLTVVYDIVLFVILFFIKVLLVVSVMETLL